MPSHVISYTCTLLDACASMHIHPYTDILQPRLKVSNTPTHALSLSHTHTYTHTRILTHKHTYKQTCTRPIPCIHAWRYASAQIHTFLHTCTYTYIHTHIHTYIVEYEAENGRRHMLREWLNWSSAHEWIHLYLRVCIFICLHVDAAWVNETKNLECIFCICS